MQLTKGAIGNLINRYRAVLKKCHLLNVFGSLAVAGMLVMGGAAAAGAAETTDKVLSEDISTSVVVSAGNSVNLDLNGYNIATSNTYALFVDGDVTISDSVGTGKIEGGSYSTVVNGSGVLRFESGLINLTNSGNPIQVQQGGQAFISGGTVSGFDTGICLYANGEGMQATVTIEGDSVIKTTAPEWQQDGDPVAAAVFLYPDNGGSVTLNVHGGTISSSTYAIAGNGLRHGTIINITGGDIRSDATAIYHPQDGVMTISGGTINGGDTGIELRSGKLTVSGGEIIGQGNPLDYDANGNGTTTVGAALAVSQHTTNKDIDVNISGGTFTGYYALFEKDMQDDDSDNIKMSVTGGEFNGKIYSENCKDFITGGTFSDPTALHYLGEGANVSIKLQQDYSGETGNLNKKAFKIGSNRTVAMDLGGHTFSMTEVGNTSAGNISIANGTLDLQKDLSLTGGTLDMVSGSTLTIENNSSLVINGGTFVADAGLLVTANGDSIYQANTNKGISDTSIVGTDGNLNLRWFDGDYTGDEYASVKRALMDSVGENATLNFLNANLKLDEGQDLVVGAKQEDNVVTIQTAPVVVATDEAPSDAADKVITSVPDQIVSVVTNDEDKTPLEADTIIVSDSKFTAKGLEIAGTAGAEAVTLKVTGSSDITLTGGEAGFTGVVNAENEAVATNVEVSNASLTVGLEGNASAQNLTLNEVTVDGGTFAVAGNGLDTTQVEANKLVTESGTVAVNNATLTVQETVVSTGVLSITNAVSDLGTVDFSGGVLFFDPSYNTHTFKNGEVGGLFLTSDGSVVNVASGLDNLQELAQKAGFTTTATGSGEFTLGTGQSMLALGQNLTLTGSGQVIVDAGVTYENTGSTYVAKIDGQNISNGAYFGNNSLLVVNGNTIKGTTAAINLAGASNQTLYVQNGAKLLIADAVAGQTYTVISGATNADTATGNAFNGGTYNSDTSTGWKGANLLTSSDMVSLTSEDGTVFKSVSADAHTVFPNLSHELATAVNTLYGQQLNDVDADAMGVRFLSRATDNRYLGADKQAAASTIESAARMAFAGAVPQMTKMASDAGTNAVVNRLGFANPADGAQAMNAEGKIVDRNTTGFALWIAPLWQNQHGWGMEAGNLDYGFNGNLGGVSLGADYTFENAIRAGITFNIGGGYAESSGGDLNSTENRMTFWGLGAYAGWNYENFGLMADVSYTSTWNDLEQDMDGRMGMGDLEADVQATAISAGLRAEYKLETSVLDIIPHIGVRYMSLNTWGYDVDTNGGTVLEGDGFHQDIWTFPIGVTFSKDFTLDSGWFFKPSVDFSVIPAAGDIKAKQDVAFTGLPGTYEVETQMMDYLTWQGGVGLEMGNDNLSFGVNYTLQAGQHTTGHGVFGSFRYEF